MYVWELVCRLCCGIQYYSGYDERPNFENTFQSGFEIGDELGKSGVYICNQSWTKNAHSYVYDINNDLQNHINF